MFDLHTYFVREPVGALKLHEAYDILDPESGDLIATATEQASPLKKVAKLFVNKNLLPFHVELTDKEGNVLLQITRGFTFLRSKVDVLDAQGKRIGFFKQKLLSVGGRFQIFNDHEDMVAELKGNLIGWDFRFLDRNEKELGKVSKKWAGVGKELFTSADNYIVHLEEGADTKALAPLMLAAALCVDMVLKEKG